MPLSSLWHSQSYSSPPICPTRKAKCKRDERVGKCVVACFIFFLLSTTYCVLVRVSKSAFSAACFLLRLSATLCSTPLASKHTVLSTSASVVPAQSFLSTTLCRPLPLHGFVQCQEEETCFASVRRLLYQEGSMRWTPARLHSLPDIEARMHIRPSRAKARAHARHSAAPRRPHRDSRKHPGLLSRLVSHACRRCLARPACRRRRRTCFGTHPERHIAQLQTCVSTG